MSYLNIKNPLGYLIIFHLLCSTALFSQNQQWVNTIGSTGGDVGYAVKVDPFGNQIVVSHFTGTVDFDPGPGVSSLTSTGSGLDISVAKYGPAGNLIWAKKMGGNGPDHPHGVTVDTSGNIYTTGYFNSACDFDPGAGTYSINNYTNYGDVFISKLDKNGNFVWAKSIGNPATNDFCFSISTDDAKNVYITGSYSGTWDFDPGVGTHSLTAVGDIDIYVLKLDANGNFAWVKTIGAAFTDDAGGVAADAQGNTYVTGYTSTSNFAHYAFVRKYNTSGSLLWNQQITGGPSYGGRISVDKMGNSYSTGNFDATSNFDANGAGYNLTGTYRNLYTLKLDINGNFVWAKLIGGSSANSVIPTSINLNQNNNFCVAGYYTLPMDMDPGPGVHMVPAYGSTEGFILVMDRDANYIGSNSVGGPNFTRIYGADIDNSGKIYATGMFRDTLKFDPASGFANIPSAGVDDIFLCGFAYKGVTGYVYNDINQNCTKQNNEPGLAVRRGVLNPGNLIIETDINGRWYIDSLPVGTYSIVFDIQPNWLATCSNTINFSVPGSNNYIVAPDFGLKSTNPCSQPDVSITAPILRRCFSNQKIYVQACNLATATGALNNASVDVVLDTALVVDNASMTYTAMGNNTYRFALGTLNPAQCVNFNLSTTVKCSTLLGRTLCMDAFLSPVDSCALDTVTTPALPLGTTPACTSAWDHSSLSVTGHCQNDSVYFVITNTGSPVNGNMQCAAPVRVYVDGVLVYTYTITLTGGQSITYAYPGNGQTWILQADQHPQHPGNSHPNAHVEACGNLTNWTSNLVNNFPLNDADPIVDTYCGLVTGSYDPNDKTGYPLGTGVPHDILPNQQLQYVIRFQNTGTDTALTVVIRDTLDIDLNIFSVVPGTSSHNYTFRIYGPGVLEWIFNNIMLPDSNSNEPLSHGFVTFRVDQKNNLPNGTTILNEADIYFDFNTPVITNQTLHTINDQLNTPSIVTGIRDKVNSTFKIYPNPASSYITIVSTKENMGSKFRVINQLGQTFVSGKLTREENAVDLSHLAAGFYLVLIENKDTNYSQKLIKQ